MKHFLLLIIILPTFVFSQRERAVIDSIHSNRLCVEYPGMVVEPVVLKEFQTSEYVFTGKVVEIIRKETLEASDIGEDGKPIHFLPIQKYWYVLEVTEQFKGASKKKITVYSRIFSNISPLLMLDKEYLIYAKRIPKTEKMFYEKSQHLYIYCNGASTHIKYVADDIKLLRKLKTN